MPLQSHSASPDACEPRATVPHFAEPGRLHSDALAGRMSDSAYSSALDHLVITCVDIVFTCGNQLLLAKRQRQPRAGWWLVGGRMVAGESPVEAVCRKAAEEAGLDGITPDRCRYIGAYSTCFALRHQLPIEHGLHSLNLTYQIELQAAEQPQVRLDADEYETWQWIDRSAAAALLNPDHPIDQALLTVICNLDSGEPTAKPNLTG